MTRTKAFDAPNDFEGGGFFNRLNRRLFPYLGPPPLGPYTDEASAAPVVATCPLCRAAMTEHRFDRSDPDRPTKLYCP